MGCRCCSRPQQQELVCPPVARITVTAAAKFVASGAAAIEIGQMMNSHMLGYFTQSLTIGS